uniref:Putative salivary secreted peptide n=1 Tax=Ixodes scapularis TaxID=6945 RepID=A0A4D5S2T5_IXOSC
MIPYVLLLAICCASQIVLQGVAATNPLLFDLEEKIQEYVDALSVKHGVKVSWWDMYGNNSQFKWFKVSTNPNKIVVQAGPIKFGEAKINSLQPKVIYTNWVHNEQPDTSTTTRVKRSTLLNTTHMQSTERAFSCGFKLSVDAKLPASAGITANVFTNFNLRNLNSESHTETEKYSVKQVVTVPPMRSVKIEWLITDVSREIPWTADIKVTGSFGVRFERRVNGEFLWYYPVTRLRDPLLKRIGPKVMQFTANGTFASVYGVDAHLRVSEYELMDKNGEPLVITNRTLPLNARQGNAAAPQ